MSFKQFSSVVKILIERLEFRKNKLEFFVDIQDEFLKSVDLSRACKFAFELLT